MKSSWKRVQVSEVCELIVDCVNKTAPRVDEPTKYKMLRTPNIRNGRVDRTDCRYVTEETYEKWTRRAKVLKGDVLLTREAPMGQVGFVDFDDTVFLGQRIMQYRVDKTKMLPEFLLYSFLSPDLQHQFGMHEGSGSVVSHIRVPDCSKFELWQPPLEEQAEIVNQIRTLDLKIDTNGGLNKTLEQIAQAIFKSWFVDFDPVKAKIAAREALLTNSPTATAEQIAKAEQQAAIKAIAGAGDVIPTEQLQSLTDLFPNQLVESELGGIPKGWAVKALDEIAHYQNGLALQKFRPEEGEDFLPVLKIAQLKAGIADGKEVAKAAIKPECIVDNGDVIFSWSGSLVVDVWCGGKVALNQHLFKVTSQNYPKWFYLKWTKHHLEQFQQIAADKAVTMGHIKRSHLSEAKCAIPLPDLLSSGIIESIIQKQIECRLESVTLSELRDTLLPKLLSGEIDLARHQKEVVNA